MSNFVEVGQVGKTFNLANGGTYIALKCIDLNVGNSIGSNLS